MLARRDNPIITAPQGPDDDDASARVAHELANLLDGSLRNIGLAIRSLRAAGATGAGGAGEAVASADEQVLHRLDTASVGLKQMASLLREWLGDAANALHQDEKIITFGEVMKRCAAMLAPAAIAAGVRLDMTCEPGAGDMAIAGDAQSSHSMAWPHLIDNLVRNGIQAIERARGATGDEPPTVQARLATRDGHIVLTVTDNGPGFATWLFDAAAGGAFRFGRSTRAGGHGVGLALCRDLATAMGGAIELTNHLPRGAQVVVRVPHRKPAVV